jgi:hypothetical protein
MSSRLTGGTASGPSASLCRYCAEIDFEMLRYPTIGDLQLLNAGGEPKDQYPYKSETSDATEVRRSLGLHSRIEESAARCPFCRAVVEIHKQQPHVLDFLRAAGLPDPLCIATIGPSGRLFAPEGVTWKSKTNAQFDFFFLRRLSLQFRPLDEGEVVQPGHLEGAITRWQTLSGCFQSYQKEDMAADRWSVPDQPDRILYGGRKRPPNLDPKLPAMWLHDCLTNHGDTCSVANNDSGSAQTARSMM